MAYDEDVADGIREVIGTEPGLAEQRMFGGLAFLVGGNMGVAAVGSGLMIRADRDESDELVEAGEAEFVVMRGRQLRGWLEVSAERIGTPEQLARWVELGVGYARSLPPK